MPGRQERCCALQHAHQHDLFAVQVAGDFGAHLRHAFGNLLARVEDFKPLISDGGHGFSIAPQPRRKASAIRCENRVARWQDLPESRANLACVYTCKEMFPYIHLGSFPIPTFGLMLWLAAVTAGFIMDRNFRRWKIDADAVGMVAIAVVAGIVGAKLWHVSTRPPSSGCRAGGCCGIRPGSPGSAAWCSGFPPS